MRALALPIASVRLAGLVTSAMYARDVLPTPLQKPSHARAMKSHATLPAQPVPRKPRATPTVEAMSTGRRPSLSEAYPVHALDAMLKTANVAKSDPSAIALPPRSSRKYARTERPSDTLVASRTSTISAPCTARACSFCSSAAELGSSASDVGGTLFICNQWFSGAVVPFVLPVSQPRRRAHDDAPHNGLMAWWGWSRRLCVPYRGCMTKVRVSNPLASLTHLT